MIGGGKATGGGGHGFSWPAWRKVGRLLGIFGWLVALSPVAHGVATGKYRPGWLAAAALISFVVLYVLAIMLAFGRRERVRTLRIALAALATVTLASAVGFGGGWLLLFVFLSAACAAGLPRPRDVVAVACVAATAGAVALMRGLDTADAVNYLLGAFAGGTLTAFVQRMRILVRELRETREELARLAVEEERLRFSRDLHDLLGHTLSLIVVKSEAVRRLSERGDNASAAREARDIEGVGRKALLEVREAVTGYRRRGLAAELDGARSALSGAGIEASVRVSGTPLPPEADALLSWAVREGTTNVIRHSRAKGCEIEVRRREGRATLEIRDDGAQPPGATSGVADGGSGLRGLAERTAAAGGRFEAGPRPGGFRLAVAVPLGEASGQAAEQLREER